MTIIDQFITDNHEVMTSQQMAEMLGASREYVNKRKSLLNCPKPKVVERISVTDEIVSLLKLIEIRQTGWAVDIAKQRIRDLSKLTNQ